MWGAEGLGRKGGQYERALDLHEWRRPSRQSPSRFCAVRGHPVLEPPGSYSPFLEVRQAAAFCMRALLRRVPFLISLGGR